MDKSRFVSSSAKPTGWVRHMIHTVVNDRFVNMAYTSSLDEQRADLPDEAA